MYCYYPGCSAKGIGKDMDIAVKAVAEKLGIKYREIEGWGCCGAGMVADLSVTGAAVLAVSNLYLAKEQGCEGVFTACGICFNQLIKWSSEIRKREDLRERIKEILEANQMELVEMDVLHFIEMIDEALSEDYVVRPLVNLKVALYPGCQAKFAFKAKGKDVFEVMERILKKIGVEIGPRIEFCCGFPVVTYDKPNSRKMAQEVVRRSLDSDAIVTLCPFCQYHIDTTVKGKPIVHLHQLVGLALGIPAKELGLDLHVNKLKL